MMNYIKVESFGLAKEVITIYACVLIVEAFFYETRDAKIDILKLAWRRSAMKRTHSSYMLEKMMICAFMSCAFFYRSRDARIDMLKLAGRCPAMKRANYASMVEKIAICVLVFSAFLHRTTHATGNMHSPWKEGEERLRG